MSPLPFCLALPFVSYSLFLCFLIFRVLCLSYSNFSHVFCMFCLLKGTVPFFPFPLFPLHLPFLLVLPSRLLSVPPFYLSFSLTPFYISFPAIWLPFFSWVLPSRVFFPQFFLHNAVVVQYVQYS